MTAREPPSTQDAKPPASTRERPYGVTRLVSMAGRSLDQRFGVLWVEGEISNLRTPSSGHRYFTLKDERATLPVVMFRSSARRLRFRLEDGQRVRCRGRLSIYEAQGRFQLTADFAEAAGAGAQQQQLEALKRKLAAEGLFERARKKPLPPLPRDVLVVSSRSGAALRDILQVLGRRCPVRVLLVPTTVQGRDAAWGIGDALRRADRVGGDVIILARGGGSAEDLSPFNNEGVARTVASARTPVISAVGHETDLTLADLVADARAPTPSAAAELAVPVFAELLETQAQWRARLRRAMSNRLRAEQLALERLRGRLVSPRQLIARGRQRFDDQTARLERAMERLLARHRAELGALAAGLEARSPLAVLARGFSVCRDESGHVVREAGAVATGDRVEITLQRGELSCRVEATRDAASDTDSAG